MALLSTKPRKKPATPKGHGLRRAAAAAAAMGSDAKSYSFPVQAPKLPRGVVPEGVRAPVAMDAAAYDYAQEVYAGGGFPGYPYLASMATRSEYRAMASAMATELTREWIKLTSGDADGGETNEKIKMLEAELKRIDLRGAVQRAAEQDCYFGRGQLVIDIKGHRREAPLILDPRTVKPGSLVRVVPVESMWTSPSAYNALDPVAPDFYRPSSWFMLGQQVHASRMLTVVTRPLPDMLKPAFNFGGMSLSQLAEPYVDNWLRTRQSVSDLINNFSITALATSMDQVLTGGDDGTDLFARATLFTQGRSNKGLMLLDKDREELIQTNTPLGGLHELQAQSQEQMCAVSRLPAIVLTGISPSGLNASSDGEIRTFYDWIAAQQEAHWRHPIETVLKVAQLSLFGEIDETIGFEFVPLYQMSPSEEADIRLKNSQSATAYINAGVLDPSEERERLARDPASGYQGLDTSIEIVPPAGPPEDEGDPEPPAPDKVTGDDWKEGDHPRAGNGQFGSGGSSKKSKAGKGKAPATGSYTDSNGNVRSGGLAPREQKIEGEFYAMVDNHAPELIGKYREKFGNVIDPDAVKKLNDDFAADPSLAGAVHEPSSKLAKIIYKKALEDKAAAGDTSPVVFTAGGSGSGKSTTMEGSLKALGANPDALLYDSVLSNPASAKSRIDQALAAQTGDVGIAYTNADIEKALYLNAKRERAVTIDTLMHAHVGATDTLRELAEHYKDNPRVKFSVMNNRGTIDQIAPGTIADVPKYEKFALREQLVKVAKGMLDAGQIDQARFDLLTR